MCDDESLSFSHQKAKHLERRETVKEVKDFLLGDGRKMPKSTSAPKSPPKYQHPDQPHVTWTGRGRHPSWFAEAIAAGTDPEELLIK